MGVNETGGVIGQVVGEVYAVFWRLVERRDSVRAEVALHRHALLATAYVHVKAVAFRIGGALSQVPRSHRMALPNPVDEAGHADRSLSTSIVINCPP